MNKKLIISLAITVMILMGCSETTPYQPQHIDTITDGKELIKRMLKSSLTRLPNGQLERMIQRNFIGNLEFKSSPSAEPQQNLSKTCRTLSECLGVVYATISQTEQQQTQIMYRIHHRNDSFNLTRCAWIETYDFNVSEMNDALTKQLKVRALKWTNTCFAEET
jgi:PBP1b-binding outer membrane lipoprotein LpoB